MRYIDKWDMSVTTITKILHLLDYTVRELFVYIC